MSTRQNKVKQKKTLINEVKKHSRTSPKMQSQEINEILRTTVSDQDINSTMPATFTKPQKLRGTKAITQTRKKTLLKHLTLPPRRSNLIHLHTPTKPRQSLQGIYWSLTNTKTRNIRQNRNLQTFLKVSKFRDIKMFKTNFCLMNLSSNPSTRPRKKVSLALKDPLTQKTTKNIKTIPDFIEKLLKFVIMESSNHFVVSSNYPVRLFKALEQFTAPKDKTRKTIHKKIKLVVLKRLKPFHCQ